jgi:polyribonucleotide nucleotidyltransferase
MFNQHSVEIEWAGRPLKLETGKVARQADGAVIATWFPQSLRSRVRTSSR